MDQDATDDRDIARRDADELVSALVLGADKEAQTLVERWIERGLSYDTICAHGIGPAMVKIGDLWEQGRIGVAQEHLATAISQRILVRAFDASTFATPSGKKALFACVPGNHHALGLRMVGDAFAIAGWDVSYLGANVPGDEVVQNTAEWRPHLLGLSVSMSDQLAAASDIAQRVRERMGDDAPRIVLGGRPLREQDPLPFALDVDVWPGHLESASETL